MWDYLICDRQQNMETLVWCLRLVDRRRSLTVIADRRRPSQIIQKPGFNRPFATSDHMVQLMLFSWAKEWDRLHWEIWNKKNRVILVNWALSWNLWNSFAHTICNMWSLTAKGLLKLKKEKIYSVYTHVQYAW